MVVLASWCCCWSSCALRLAHGRNCLLKHQRYSTGDPARGQTLHHHRRNQNSALLLHHSSRESRCALPSNLLVELDFFQDHSNSNLSLLPRFQRIWFFQLPFRFESNPVLQWLLLENRKAILSLARQLSPLIRSVLGFLMTINYYHPVSILSASNSTTAGNVSCHVWNSAARIDQRVLAFLWFLFSIFFWTFFMPVF